MPGPDQEAPQKHLGAGEEVRPVVVAGAVDTPVAVVGVAVTLVADTPVVGEDTPVVAVAVVGVIDTPAVADT